MALNVPLPGDGSVAMATLVGYAVVPTVVGGTVVCRSVVRTVGAGPVITCSRSC